MGKHGVCKPAQHTQTKMHTRQPHACSWLQHSRLVDVGLDLRQLPRDFANQVVAQLVGQVGCAGVVQVTVGL